LKSGIDIDVIHVLSKQPFDTLRNNVRRKLVGRYFVDEFPLLSDADIVIVTTGVESVDDKYIRKSLKNKQHVITPNKVVMAKHGAEYFDLANQHGVTLMFESSICGAVPIVAEIRDMHNTGATNIFPRGTKVEIIGNGTTNFMLGLMNDGHTYDAALKTAQDMGFAEADPTADVGGFDTARKLALIASLMTKKTVNWEDFKISGIDVPEAQNLISDCKSETPKLVGSFTLGENGTIIDPTVSLRALSNNDIFITNGVHGELSAVHINIPEQKEPIFLKERGAGSEGTGQAVYDDIIYLATMQGTSKRISKDDARYINALISWSKEEAVISHNTTRAALTNANKNAEPAQGEIVNKKLVPQ
jgi:homoserine dehydrogenase